MLMFLLCGADVEAQEQDEAETLINHAYPVIFGTGIYEVNGQTAFIIRAPLSYTLRETSPSQPGMNLLLPLLAGYYDYDY